MASLYPILILLIIGILFIGYGVAIISAHILEFDQSQDDYLYEIDDGITIFFIGICTVVLSFLLNGYKL